MSKSEKRRVEVQKGAIECATPPTRKMQTCREKVEEDNSWMDGRRDGQILKLHTPKPK